MNAVNLSRNLNLCNAATFVQLLCKPENVKSIVADTDTIDVTKKNVAALKSAITDLETAINQPTAP